jgi:transcription elongation GreA/GreB family factor
MTKQIDKRVLFKKLLELTKIKEAEIRKASKDAQERANEAEGAMQSRYDTFKEEGQNLAGGLKIRHEELKASVSILKEILNTNKFEDHVKIQHYSYVEVEFEDGNESMFFITPIMGGEKLNENITIITPASPIGNCLMGKEEGDEFKYVAGNIKKRGEVIRIV